MTLEGEEALQGNIHRYPAGYFAYFWTSSFKKEVKVLECVEGRVAKLVKGLECPEEQLRSLGLSSLEKMMLKGDCIALYS